MNKILVLLCFAIIFMIGCNGNITKEVLSPSVVLYVGNQGAGSGVVIDKYEFTDKEDIAIVLTANHVVEMAQQVKKEIKVMLFSYKENGRLKDFKKVDSISAGGNKFFDLSFLIIFIPKNEFSSAEITKKFQVLPGDILYCSATPAGCIPIVNKGVFGGYYPTDFTKTIKGVFTGGVQKGCSGGPVFNENNELVGIVCGYAILQKNVGPLKSIVEYKHYGFFTPVDQGLINNLKTLLIGLIEKGQKK